MKRFVRQTALLAAIATTVTMAEGYKQADRIADMQQMAQAMQDIQSGFFYNNVDIVKAGTKSVEVSVDAVHDMAVMAYKKKSAIDEVAKIVEKYGE